MNTPGRRSVVRRVVSGKGSRDHRLIALPEGIATSPAGMC
jgi:hypothetical protein